MREVGRLHVLTDTGLQSRFTHPEIAEMAIRGGADVIQFREKAASTREQIVVVRRLVELARRSGAKLIVNDRIDVAIAADAHGVHLGHDDFPLTLAREWLGPDRIIGASVRSLEEAHRAAQAGADYLGAGPVRATASKADAGPVIALEELRSMVGAVEIPVIAIGGIDADSVAEIMHAGVHGIAVIRAVSHADDPAAAAAGLRAIMEQVLKERRYPW
jgi:thiamine-phosphate pyrophosphorylase